jgi:hypothetical protein
MTATLTPVPEPFMGPGTAASADGPTDPGNVLGFQLTRRLLDPNLESWLHQAAATGGCSRPVRLVGTVHEHDPATGETVPVLDTATLPDGVLYKPCGDRREALCPACARVYQRDAYQLLKTGLVGGKGVPESVTSHPCVFLTLTAPSFGHVHTRRTTPDGRVLPCRPRRKRDRCPHGVDLRCTHIHREGDRRLGRPLCADCYDYRSHVVFNGHISELWRRTRITLEREVQRVARRHGGRVRLAYAKVAEYQQRGVVHFHALIRLDGLDPADREQLAPPPACLDGGELARLVAQVVPRVGMRTAAHPTNPAGWALAWGRQLDARVIRSAPTGEITDGKVIAYLAKYATKSSDAIGGVPRSICCPACKGTGLAGTCPRCAGTGLRRDLAKLPVDTHIRTLMETCWRLGDLPRDADDRYRGLRRWAHMLGYGGHFTTKSRRYSLTFTHLRHARRDHQRQQARLRRGDPIEDTTPVLITSLQWAGLGWLTDADAQLATSIATRSRIYVVSDQEYSTRQIA